MIQGYIRLIGGAETIEAHATNMHETGTRKGEARVKESHQSFQLIDHRKPKPQASCQAIDTVRTSQIGFEKSIPRTFLIAIQGHRQAYLTVHT